MTQSKETPLLNIGLSEEDRKGVIGILSKVLADEYLLFTKTRNYHWNVVGPHFHDLHKFFESQYEEVDGKIDEIADISIKIKAIIESLKN